MAIKASYISGQTVEADILRRALYASTSGAAGVTRATDLKVTALSTPGAAVWINRGSAVVPTAFSDADPGQSYVLTNSESYQVEVPANNSASARTLHVVAVARDPQYAGNPAPADPTTDAYADVQLVSTLPSGKPFIHLATITTPAQTGVVQASHITDKRKLANQRSQTVFYTRDIPSTFPANLKGQWKQWPGDALWNIDVPAWATHMHVQHVWNSVMFPAGWNVTMLSVRVGHGTPEAVYIHNTTTVTGSTTGATTAPQITRGMCAVADSIPVPAAWRGTSIAVYPAAYWTSGTGQLSVDQWASESITVQFTEDAI